MSDASLTNYETRLILDVKRLTAALEQAQEQIDSLQQKVHLCAGYDELQTRVKQLEVALNNLLAAKGDHMTACDRTMGATHPCTCGVNEARQLLAGDSASTPSNDRKAALRNQTGSP